MGGCEVAGLGNNDNERAFHQVKIGGKQSLEIRAWHEAYSVKRMFADDLERDDDQHNPWPAISIVAEEIILSEMLTRVWSAVITQKSSNDQQSEFASIAHSILIGHVEARNRAFRILLDIPHWAKPTAEKHPESSATPPAKLTKQTREKTLKNKTQHHHEAQRLGEFPPLTMHRGDHKNKHS